MSRKILSVVGSAIIASAMYVSTAVATPVVLNELQNQTSNGQDFTFNFNGLAASDGTGGTLTVHLQGDYHGGTFENANVLLDGGVFTTGLIGGCTGTSPVTCLNGPYDLINLEQNLGNIELEISFALSGAVMDSLLSDSSISVFVDNSADVGLFNPPNFAEITIAYNAAVPEPLSALLLATGLAGIGAMRRKA